jgi:hypothetical protein
MSNENEKLAERVTALEKLCSEMASELESLAPAKGSAKALDTKDPLHPGKAGTSEYAALVAKLRSVKPHEKEYAAAQAQLRAAGFIS